MHDYLATIALPGVVDQILLEGNQFYEKRNDEVWMPLEFSVAAFRFGHTMVRGAYDYNRNFGRPGRVIGAASFGLLFTFTGKGGFRGQTDVLPFNWVIEWERFVERDPRFTDHFSRKIDTRLADALGRMANESQGETVPTIIEILQHLAVRNLLRGYQLSMPTGQAVAGQLGLLPLTEEELQEGNSDELNQLLASSGFLQKTPLWYYVLKEAEVQSGGNSLGEAGSRIVAETLIGQIRNDPTSYLAANLEPWVPGARGAAAGRSSDPDHEGLPAIRRSPADASVTVVANEAPLRVPNLGTRAAKVIAAPQEAWRSDSPQRKRAYARRRGIDTTKLKTVKQLDQALEKVIGDRDFLPSRWLRRAANAAEAVARVRTPADFGTGFLVTPWLLMTNHHVLDSVSVAEVSTVTFRYEEDDNEELHDTIRLALQPERCFVTSPIAELDLTLVAVAPTPDGEPPGKTFGHIVAPGPTGKVLLGQPVNILQHPDGRPREIAVRNNLLLSVDDDLTLTYGTDTERGSSGSPVLSDRWELVALHHSSKTEDGVVGNVGIRVSAIVGHIRTLVADQNALAAAGTDAEALLGEFLDLGKK